MALRLEAVVAAVMEVDVIAVRTASSRPNTLYLQYLVS
jgi:hypothetical protein